MNNRDKPPYKRGKKMTLPFKLRINASRDGRLIEFCHTKRILKKEHAKYIENLQEKGKIEQAEWEGVLNWCDKCGLTAKKLKRINSIELCPSCFKNKVE